MDGITQATRTMLDESCEALRITVNGLGPETLAREPAPEANSLATLVRHATSSTRFLLGCAATGSGDFARYRAGVRSAAFAGDEAMADELIGLIDALEEEGRRLIARMPTDALGETVALVGQTDNPPTRAYVFLHALEHLREHVGHAQLTRQVLVS